MHCNVGPPDETIQELLLELQAYVFVSKVPITIGYMTSPTASNKEFGAFAAKTKIYDTNKPLIEQIINDINADIITMEKQDRDGLRTYTRYGYFLYMTLPGNIIRYGKTSKVKNN